MNVAMTIPFRKLTVRKLTVPLGVVLALASTGCGELAVRLAIGSIGGLGRVHAPDPMVAFDCSRTRLEEVSYHENDGCTAGFADLGGGGMIDLVAEPADGWQFAGWRGACADFAASTCTLSFVETPVLFSVSVSFVRIPPDAIVFSDDFESGCEDWSSSPTINGPGTTSETCAASGGRDGGRYRQMQHELTDVGNLVVEHEYTAETLRVGAGAGDAVCAATVRFREWRTITQPAFNGAAVGASVWILQNGTRYRAGAGPFDHTEWTEYDSGDLSADDFTPAGLDLCPEAGTDLTFGYSRSNSNTSVGALQRNVHGIDDWSVIVTPVQ